MGNQVQGVGRERTIYVDESGAPSFADSGSFCVGALVLPQPLAPGHFRPYLDRLAQDADRDALDDETLRRGYFHGCEDSKNGHSYACRGVTAISGPGEFHFERLDKTQLHGRAREELTGESVLHGHLLEMLSTQIWDRELDRVHFVVAERQGSFVAAHAQSWQEGLLDAMAYSAVLQPALMLSVPEIQVTVEKPTSDGLQACDFLLWATQRARIEGKEDWVGRAPLHTRSQYRMPRGPHSGEDFYLAAPFNDEHTSNLDTVRSYSGLHDQLVAKENLRLNGLVIIESIIRQVLAGTLTVRNSNLRDRVERLREALRDQSLKPGTLIELARLYLLCSHDAYRACDTDAKRDLVIQAKILASRAANVQEVSHMQACWHWRAFRENFLQKAPPEQVRLALPLV